MTYIWRKHILELTSPPWKILRLADPTTPADVKQSIRQEFASTRRCCLPPGLAVALKVAKVDLLSEDTLQFLYWYARMIRLTAADVEARRSRNNHSSGTSGNIDFGNIAAQYVLNEFSHLKRVVAML